MEDGIHTDMVALTESLRTYDGKRGLTLAQGQ
jgi:hypothetical protein